MIVRYAYRIYPSTEQQQALARTFGCARVVFNDALHVWREAHAHGIRLTDTQVQNRVITQAKHAAHREWLAEVSSVALIQSFQDARQARSNRFASIKGTRKGKKIGWPRDKRKRGKQSIRLTRNGFALRPDGTMYVAKVGNLNVRWSRALPSIPSSVTITREPDGRFYASFVVEIQPVTLPATGADVGIDLGLTTLVVTSDGRQIPNPRRLKAKARHLARAQRALARKQKGSRSRKKAAVKVAVLHRKVRNSRADYAHKTAIRLIRDNQAVYVEDLAVSGLARTRLAKSVHDAAWGMLVRLLEEKAVMYGRQVVKVDRWFPSSQLCSVCGHRDGPKPLGIREWTCLACGAVHDRDMNAARNILVEGRRVAAGQVATVCGGDVSPGLLVPAAAYEAETLVA